MAGRALGGTIPKINLTDHSYEKVLYMRLYENNIWNMDYEF